MPGTTPGTPNPVPRMEPHTVPHTSHDATHGDHFPSGALPEKLVPTRERALGKHGKTECSRAAVVVKELRKEGE